MIYLEIGDVLAMHHRLIEQTGGSSGVRDMGLLHSALAQPQMTFGGAELYPTIIDKAAALAYSLVKNHPFIDGNKRIAHAVMETFLVVNGQEIAATTDEQEAIVLALAASRMDRAAFLAWLARHLIARP